MPVDILRIVPCTSQYWEFVRLLRMDPRTAEGWLQTAEITPQQQQAYMSKHSHEYYIALKGAVAVGYVGSVDGDIRICTHPDYQGAGIGRFMVSELMRRHPESFAKIKVNNARSRSLFEACGFVPSLVIYEFPKA